MVMIAVMSYFFTKDDDNSFTDIIPILAALALGGQRLLPLTQQLYASWASIQSFKFSTGCIEFIKSKHNRLK